jgi:PAS domain S-box-containing protein
MRTSAPRPASGSHSGWTALFWAAFKRSRTAMVLLDDHRRHVEVNGAYIALLGYPRDALIGRPIYEFVPEGPLISDRAWRAELHKRHFTGLVELLCHDGRGVRVEFAAHPERVTGERLVLFVAMRTARGVRRLSNHDTGASVTAGLTSRECQVTELIALGLSGTEIADELHISHATVRTHVLNSMKKVGARSRAQLVAKVMAEGTCWDSPARESA